MKKRIRLFGMLAGLLLAIGLQSISGSRVFAATTTPCSLDLAVTKKVKVGDRDFVEAHDANHAPTAKIGSKVVWKLIVTNLSTGDCQQQVKAPIISVTIVLHDAMPAGFSYVSSKGDGTYDSNTNNWSFGTDTPLNPNSNSLSMIINSTPTQAGTFQNVATLDRLIVCTTIQPECLNSDYAIDSPSDPLMTIKDQNSGNDSSDAWVNICQPKRPKFSLFSFLFDKGRVKCDKNSKDS